MRCLEQVLTEEEERRLIMIKTNELRVLDLVKIKTSNDAAYYPIYAIDVIHQKVILGGARECEGWKDISLLKPIPLSHEILEFIGFTFTHGGVGWHTYKMDNVTLSIVPTNSKSLLLGYPINGDYRYIQHFHELQNLYYTFTEKELNIPQLI